MPAISVRELARDTAAVLGKLQKTKKPVLLTKRGRVIAMISPMSQDDVEDYILSNAPEFVESMREADEDIKAGRYWPLEDVMREIRAERRAKAGRRKAGQARPRKARSSRGKASRPRARTSS